MFRQWKKKSFAYRSKKKNAYISLVNKEENKKRGSSGKINIFNLFPFCFVALFCISLKRASGVMIKGTFYLFIACLCRFTFLFYFLLKKNCQIWKWTLWRTWKACYPEMDVWDFNLILTSDLDAFLMRFLKRVDYRAASR
jgi:hypothetical protein